jgi:hypothetical protein
LTLQPEYGQIQSLLKVRDEAAAFQKQRAVLDQLYTSQELPFTEADVRRIGGSVIGSVASSNNLGLSVIYDEVRTASLGSEQEEEPLRRSINQ